MFHTELIAADKISIRLFWADGVIQKTKLNWASGRQSDQNLTPHGKQLKKELIQYERGKRIIWSDLPLNFSNMTPFRQKVLIALYKNITWGKSTSYKYLSELAESPRAARAVGSTMANNPFALIVPCHRVLAAGNRIGGFSGAGVPMKEYLLSLEKIPFKND